VSYNYSYCDIRFLSYHLPLLSKVNISRMFTVVFKRENKQNMPVRVNSSCYVIMTGNLADILK